MAKKNGGIQNFSLRRIILERARINEHRQNSRTNDVESGSTKQGNCENVNNDGNYQKVIVNEKEKCEFSDNICGNLQSEDTDSCAICFLKQSETNKFFTLNLCKHTFCSLCLTKYLKNEINESRTDIACPQCSIQIHPDDIECLLQNTPEFIKKYEEFMIRRCLVTDPDSRWCPAPDCSFAVIASGCASCPQLQCERPDCRVSFCYHCKAEWHPDQTCDAARALRQSIFRSSSVTFSHDSTKRDDIKPCPRCQVLIIKVDDGSCNHMICSVCGSEFCWLCMKEVSDLHYLSPSGCTFWGKKPWSRKKKIVWQIGTLIGAPVGIALLAGIAIPSMIIGIPIWVARKLLERYKMKTKQKRNILVTIGVSASVLISPLLAGLAIAIGVPILLFLVYGIVPISLCRAGCGNPTNEEYKFGDNVTNEYNGQYGLDANSVEAISRLGGISLGDLSLSGASGSLTDNVNRNLSTNVAHHGSTTALAGSINQQNVKNCTSDIPYDETTNKIISITSMGRLDEEV